MLLFCARRYKDLDAVTDTTPVEDLPLFSVHTVLAVPEVTGTYPRVSGSNGGNRITIRGACWECAAQHHPWRARLRPCYFRLRSMSRPASVCHMSSIVCRVLYAQGRDSTRAHRWMTSLSPWPARDACPTARPGQHLPASAPAPAPAPGNGTRILILIAQRPRPLCAA